MTVKTSYLYKKPQME